MFSARGGFLTGGGDTFVLKANTGNIVGSLPLAVPIAVIGTNVVIDWGDGNVQSYASATPSAGVALTHQYGIANTEYIISVSGNITGIDYQSYGLATTQIKDVINWGPISWSKLNFSRCRDLTITATDIPTFTSGANLAFGFAFANNFNSSVSFWNTANVANMHSMFANTTTFNQSLNTWNTANVTNMSNMFNTANAFNQTLNSWNTANVSNMAGMFSNAHAFNQTIGSWNTANVVNMSNMFSSANVFNQTIGSWNTAKVTNMSYMFANADTFNQAIGSWNTANVTDMTSMFNSANVFNQNLNSWNVANVTGMSNMFRDAVLFNGNIAPWNTANVVNMQSMFQGANVFNSNISGWNVAKVTDMSFMFNNADGFNRSINSWNTANVTTMNTMFYEANVFNQNIGNIPLRVAGVNMTAMLGICNQDTANYSQTLIGWANYVRTNSGPYNTTLGATGRTYSNASYGGTFYANAVAARAYLVASTGSGGAGWTISGDTRV